MLTDISFYHLQRVALERALPKLLEKVLERGHRVLVLVGSEERLEALNRALWTYEQRSFLPHGGPHDGNAADQPIYLATSEDNPNRANVLVLVDGVVPDHLDPFDRCLDMFDGNDPDAVAHARERLKALSASGHALTYWQQSADGAWRRAD